MSCPSPNTGVQDAVTNKSSEKKKELDYRLHIDRTKPEVDLEGELERLSDEGWVSDEEISARVEARDNMSGIKALELWVKNADGEHRIDKEKVCQEDEDLYTGTKPPCPLHAQTTFKVRKQDIPDGKNTFEARAVEFTGHKAREKETVLIDNTAPAAPRNLKITRTFTNMANVSWDRPPEPPRQSDISGYEYAVTYVGSGKIIWNSVPHTGTPLMSLPPYFDVTILVRTLDAAYNRSIAESANLGGLDEPEPDTDAGPGEDAMEAAENEMLRYDNSASASASLQFTPEFRSAAQQGGRLRGCFTKPNPHTPLGKSRIKYSTIRTRPYTKAQEAWAVRENRPGRFVRIGKPNKVHILDHDPKHPNRTNRYYAPNFHGYVAVRGIGKKSPSKKHEFWIMGVMRDRGKNTLTHGYVSAKALTGSLCEKSLDKQVRFHSKKNVTKDVSLDTLISANKTRINSNEELRVVKLNIEYISEVEGKRSYDRKVKWVRREGANWKGRSKMKPHKKFVRIRNGPLDRAIEILWRREKDRFKPQYMSPKSGWVYGKLYQKKKAPGRVKYGWVDPCWLERGTTRMNVGFKTKSGKKRVVWCPTGGKSATLKEKRRKVKTLK